jgi:hypothetical protein
MHLTISSNISKGSPSPGLSNILVIRSLSANLLSSKYEYQEFIPGGFRIGDIVEMQVCFVGVTVKNTVKITTRLQALTLLDNSFTKVRSA